LGKSAKSRIRRLGFQRERALVQSLWKLGFACVRGPASGSKTRRVIYPDIVAMKEGTILVIEVKTSDRRKPIYIERRQVERLKEFARRAGGIPLIGVSFADGTGWKFVRVEDLVKTRGGNYKVDDEVLAKSLSLRDLARIADKSHKLDEYLSS